MRERRAGCRPGTVTGPAERPVATVRTAPGFWGSMDTDEPLIAALADDLDASFEGLVLAHQDRLYSIALRMLGDPRDAEEAAQDALVRAYRALAGYDAARIRELRLRPWLATIVLEPVPRRGSPGGLLAREDRPVARPGTAGRARAAARRAAGPAAVADTPGPPPRDWADLLLTLPPAYRSAVVLRHVDGLQLSRSSPSPSIDPRAPSRRRSIAAWPCCARRSRPPSGASARR